ncbi:hypothetical protein HDE_01942 [Halotydeus destructor]|nr:hypothetical protein HDE_01942 [Halotydeus destructor]
MSISIARRDVTLPDWLGAQKENRSRGFMVVKLILFTVLVIGVIEMLIATPIYYSILETEAQKGPVGQDADRWTIALSTVLSVAYGLLTFTIGLLGTLRENFALVIAYVILLLCGAVYTLVKYETGYVILVISAISNFLVACLALFFAYLIRKYDRKNVSRV